MQGIETRSSIAVRRMRLQLRYDLPLIARGNEFLLDKYYFLIKSKP